MYILSFPGNTHRIEFVDSENIEFGENVYTIVVGKNGTGKSTLLALLVKEFIGPAESMYYSKGLNLFSLGKIHIEGYPKRVIAVSTSPFDKFPIFPKPGISNYTYLGIRNLNALNFSKSYLNRIFSSLTLSVYSGLLSIEKLTEVLRYLGYRESIIASLEFDIKFRESLDQSEGGFLKDISSPGKYESEYFLTYDDSNISKLENIRGKLRKNKAILSRKSVLTIDASGIAIDHGYFGIDEDDFMFLLFSGFLKLREFSLVSNVTGLSISIGSASSGEQSIILGILGIASKIKDHSLICIDEPELCLHPQWQEKYIQLLISTFSGYKGCHFVITTHSPQVVSKLASRNCFVVSMEDGKIMNADKFINNSIDFQLANLFDSPGFKNEYLTRIAINIFKRVSKQKKFEEKENKDLDILKTQYFFMEYNDPLKELIDAIKEMKEIYG